MTNEKISFADALKYPFINFRSFWNFYWVFVPLFGMFFFFGYLLDMVKSVVNGSREGLPEREGFWNTTKEGFFFFLYMIPFYFGLFIIGVFLPYWIYLTVAIVFSFAYMILFVKYALDRNFSVLYDFGWAFNKIFGNIGEFAWFLLLLIGVYVVLLAASMLMITMIITMPAIIYSAHFLYARLYKELA